MKVILYHKGKIMLFLFFKRRFCGWTQSTTLRKMILNKDTNRFSGYRQVFRIQTGFQDTDRFSGYRQEAIRCVRQTSRFIRLFCLPIIVLDYIRLHFEQDTTIDNLKILDYSI